MPAQSVHAQRPRRCSCSSTPTSDPARRCSTGSPRRRHPVPSCRCSRGTTPSPPASALTLLANVTALMGCGRVHRPRRPASPPTSRSDRCSPSSGPPTTPSAGTATRRCGPASPRTSRSPAGSGAARLFTDRRDATFRMYPRGLRPVDGRVVADDGRRPGGDALVDRRRRRRLDVVARRRPLHRLGGVPAQRACRCGCSAGAPGGSGPCSRRCTRCSSWPWSSSSSAPAGCGPGHDDVEGPPVPAA